MVMYQLRSTAAEIEDIMRCYDLESINSVLDKLLTETYGETKGSIFSVSIDPDSVNSDILIITVLKK
jgi:hypothetical protein